MLYADILAALLTTKPEFRIEQTQSIGRGGFGEVFLSYTTKDKIPVCNYD